MELMIQRIIKLSAYVLVPVAVGALFFAGWKFSLSIIIGGLIAIVNLKGIVWSVRGLLGAEKAQAKMMALSIFKLLFIFSILIILAILRVIKPYALLIGLTVVFAFIIKEGLLTSKEEDKNDQD